MSCRAPGRCSRRASPWPVHPCFAQLGSPDPSGPPILASGGGAERANLGRSTGSVRRGSPDLSPHWRGTDPDRPLMTRILRSVAFALALATVGLGAGRSPGRPGNTAAPSNGFTPLPPGWEYVRPGGVTLPPPPPTSPDLDEWQAAEGGSTNNTAAFNPFNTQRTTDPTNTPIPGVDSANGFPAFPTWAAGMFGDGRDTLPAEHVGHHRRTPGRQRHAAAAFLAVVDQSQSCAPSSTGVHLLRPNAMEVTPAA